MVRTGRLETMKPLVKDISVVELAKRDARSTAQVLECVESVDLEVCWKLCRSVFRVLAYMYIENYIWDVWRV